MIAQRPRDFKSPKFEYSKLLPIISLVLFCAVLVVTFTTDFSNGFDTTVYVTAISVSGGIFGMIAKSYNAKAKAENISKIQQTMYHDTMKTRLWYNEKMCQIKQKYNMTDEDIMDIENSSPIDEISEEQASNMKNTLDNFMSDATEQDDVQTY